MSISFPDEVRLDEVIPLVDRLSEVEREELRQFLESKTDIDWKAEWKKVEAHFHKVFAKFSEDEVEADLAKTVREFRSS